METMSKQSVSFVDANRNKVCVTIEFRDQNGMEELSFTGDIGTSSGQCQDNIKPATKAQRQLLKLWKRYHLNGMSAGTPEQNKAIVRVKDRSYDNLVRVLKEKGLLTVKYNGKPYTYGHGWIYQTLPVDIHSQIDTLIETIQAEETARAGKQLSELSDDELLEVITEQTNFTDRDAELAAAFVRMLDLSEDDLQDIEINDARATVQGVEYIAGDDSEMDSEWDSELDNYLDEWEESKSPYFDTEAWKRDARMDGRGHALNRYNGDELEQKINDTWYYAYRQ